MRIKHLMQAMGAVAVLNLAAWSSADAACAGNCAAWEGVEKYNGNSSDLSKTIDEGQKFEAALANWGSGWVTDFRWTDDLAWERDFKTSALGGTDTVWMDDVDLGLFTGHGNQNGVFLGVNQDDLTIRWDEALLGDKDLEWLILDACLVLSDNAGKWNRWGWPVFKGLHYIFSYSSITYDVDSRGEDFVKYAAKHNWRVRNAWIKATILSESGTTAAYMRADNRDSDTYRDHLWGHGFVSTDPDNPTMLAYMSWSTD